MIFRRINPIKNLLFYQSVRFFKWTDLPNLPKFNYIKDDDSYLYPHATYQVDDIKTVNYFHYRPKNIRDFITYALIVSSKKIVDTLTLFKPETASEKAFIIRFIILELLASVPGLQGGYIRHLLTLLCPKRDLGFIHTLIEEAENERMHLLFFTALHSPSMPLKVIGTFVQYFFSILYGLCYLVFPRACHRFVGYLEEKAVLTYSQALNNIDSKKGSLSHWAEKPAVQIGISYYKLNKNATMRDLILAIRADEVIHREVNHYIASQSMNEPNKLS